MKSNIKNKFVPYIQSLKLKKLGFDEECFGYYMNDDSIYKGIKGKLSLLRVEVIPNGQLIIPHKNSGDPFNTTISAPLWSDTFDWFRNNKDLHSFIDVYPTESEPERCWFMIRGIKTKDNTFMSGWFENDIKAKIGCVNKLIELCKK